MSDREELSESIAIMIGVLRAVERRLDTLAHQGVTIMQDLTALKVAVDRLVADIKAQSATIAQLQAATDPANQADPATIAALVDELDAAHQSTQASATAVGTAATAGAPAARVNPQTGRLA